MRIKFNLFIALLLAVSLFIIPGYHVAAEEGMEFNEEKNTSSEEVVPEQENGETNGTNLEQETVSDAINSYPQDNDEEKEPQTENVESTDETSNLGENEEAVEESDDMDEKSSTDADLKEENEVLNSQSLQRYVAPTASLPYKKGDVHEDITTIKIQLNRLGFSGLAVGPVFGDLTERRVKEFQKYYDLTPTGEVDQETKHKLNEIYNSPYQNGKTNAYTTEIKKMLNALGYGGLAEGPVYGNLTERRIKEFQRDHGLKVHGIADEPTIEALKATYGNTEFKNGDTHPTVTEIKRKLNRLGFNGLAVGPVFGDLTERRVREFQEYYGLNPTGVADQQTQQKLDEIYNSPYQNGKTDAYTTEIKKMLNALGYGGLAEGPVYGNLTERRIKEFQRDHGLKAHGIADELTLETLRAVYNKTEFKNGDTHPKVTDIKRKLNRLGFNGLAEGPVFGNLTERRVKEFQEYYGLDPTGVVDQKTQQKLDEVYNSPYQKGQSNSYTTEIKKMLNALGYGGLAEGPVYGNLTERRIKEFQRDHGLKAHGIADEVTIEVLNQVYKTTEFKIGDTHPKVTEIKRKLNRLGFDGLAEGPVFGNLTERRIKEFQEYYGLNPTGVADQKTQQKLNEIYNSPYQNGRTNSYTTTIKKMLNSIGYSGLAEGPVYGNLTERRVKQFQRDHGLKAHGIADDITIQKLIEVYESRITYLDISLTLEKALDIQMSITNPPPQTDKYRNKPAYVSAKYVKELGSGKGRITGRVNVRAEANASSHIYGKLAKGTDITIIEKINNNWYRISYGTWRNATRSDTEYYLDPENNDMFQHLDLSTPAGATISELNAYLKGRGTLDGQGQAFYDAARKHNINELYLISHAIHETDHGKSKLAQGVVVNGKKVYNMFGIGADDDCPVECGAKRAYEEGWDTPYKAIVGGAKFIGKRYIHNEYKQNTLYKMRWNPVAMEQTGRHGRQYATDIGWAAKQTDRLKELYNLYVSNPVLRFNVVRYS